MKGVDTLVESADATSSTLSVLCARPVSEPAHRLYLLHHAGGSHSTYRSWPRLLPDDWEVRLIVAPGRAKAAMRPAVRDLAVVSGALADHLAESDDVPYSLFGHSMGALAAFDAALMLQTRGTQGPEWVGVSGHPGPFNSITWSRPPLYLLPPEELREALIMLDGLPERILSDRWLWERVQPLVRTDLEAAETFRPSQPSPVLTSPMSAFCGDRDPVAGPADAANWVDHTTEFLGVRPFPGSHFYFQKDPAPLAQHIVADIRAVAGETSRTPG